MSTDSDCEVKQTPLRSTHEKLGARMTPFAGWNMPVQYTGIKDEHLTVRDAVGIFDISHMGQFIVEGDGAAAWLNTMFTADVCKLDVEQGQYTFMLNDGGGVIDDLILYRTGESSYFMVVNASMIDEDFAWLNGRLADGLSLANHSEAWAGLAVQGPKSSLLFGKMFGDSAVLPARNGISSQDVDGELIIICRTGYTGEDGYEFFCMAQSGGAWLERFLSEGAEFGCKPCGLGARDTLRLEVCYPLNGSDLSPHRTPLEAGMKFAIAMKKGDFIGRGKIADQIENGMNERLVAFMMREKSAPPRPHYKIFSGETELGEIASGGLSPSLNQGIGMAYLPEEFCKLGTEIEIDIRGRRFKAEVVKKPIYEKA